MCNVTCTRTCCRLSDCIDCPYVRRCPPFFCLFDRSSQDLTSSIYRTLGIIAFKFGGWLSAANMQASAMHRMWGMRAMNCMRVRHHSPPLSVAAWSCRRGATAPGRRQARVESLAVLMSQQAIRSVADARVPHHVKWQPHSTHVHMPRPHA